MTASELSTLLSAVDSLGGRLDARIDRLEEKVDRALERRDSRLAAIEEDIRGRRATDQVVGRFFGASRATVAITLALVSTVLTAYRLLAGG